MVVHTEGGGGVAPCKICYLTYILPFLINKLFHMCPNHRHMATSDISIGVWCGCSGVLLWLGWLVGVVVVVGRGCEQRCCF